MARRERETLEKRLVGLTDGLDVGLESNSWSFGLGSEIDGEGNGTPLQYSCLENPMDG